LQKRYATVAVIGAGDYIGGEIAKKFASEGFTIFAGRRNGAKLEPLVKEIEAAGGEIHARSLDARKEEEIISFLGDADKHAPLEVCIFNIGANVNFPILDTTERVFRKVWEMACYSGFLAGREAARLMLPRGKGNIFFTGATASLRGGTGYAAFASAKFGLRAVAQATARELGPKNIHVAHLIIDSGVDTEWVRQRRIEALGPDALDNPDLLMPPSSVAESYWLLYQQPRSAWTFELEIRPFGEKVRTFIAKNYPQEMRVANPETDLTKEQMLLWHRILYRQGWIAPLWPKEYGGPGWSITQRFVFEQETSRAGTLPPLAFSVTMVGPVIYTFGSDAQKERFLPRILSGEDWWCQGYSEPGSGSDLASVRTKAVRDGDHYIVNGHKTWTTLAQHADWIFCLVRTDPAAKAQAGISFLLIDMKSPGVTVRPIITIDGSHEVNDVFLEDVRVPIENLIGEENKGWTYAKFLLGNERTSMASIGRSTRYLNRLKQIVKTEIPEDDPSFGEFIKDIARVELDVLALEATELRVVARMARGIDPGPAASLFKIRGTEIFQRITELTHQAIGNYGLAIREQPVGANRFMPGPDYGHTASEKYLNSRKLSIYGGSNEIQRNIIAKAVLGL